MKERYCSYEISELLDELGFDEELEMFYYRGGDKNQLCFDMRGYCNSNLRIVSPTHQMAEDWIRDNFNIHLTTEPYITEEGCMFLFNVFKMEKERFCLIKTKTGFDKNEDAVSSGLLYILNEKKNGSIH